MKISLKRILEQVLSEFTKAEGETFASTKLTKNDKVSVKHGRVFVNDKPFVVTFPDEEVIGYKDGCLITQPDNTIFVPNRYAIENIQGHYVPDND